MNILERLMLWHTERYLAPYRNSASMVEVDVPEYRSYVPILTRCYEDAAYWHGTGHYHYRHSSSSRYKNLNKNEVTDILESIFKEGKLLCHKDVWVELEDKHLKTISLAPSRMHARLYAHIHLYEGVWLKYVFGGTRFWMGLFIVLALRELFSGFSKEKRTLVRHMVGNSRSLREHARIWASAIRNLDRLTLLSIWRAYDLRSDIKGNHPVLFGIKKDAVQGNGILPFFRRLEVRTGEPISLRYITHMEVPLAHVKNTEFLLQRMHIILPVIPLEFGELYCSKIPLKKLVYA